MLQKARFFIEEMLHLGRSIRLGDGAAQLAPAQIGTLESRVLFSATPLAVVGDAIDSQECLDGECEPQSGASEQLGGETQQQSARSETTRTEIAIVDSSVANYQQLIDDLASYDKSERDFDVFVLSADEDGVDQVSEILSEYSDVDAIHFVSHGSEGRMKLGATWLDNDSLMARAGDIANWNGALSVDADFLIYGCDLASNTEGQDLVESLSALTGADVAASVDDTGHVQYAADWDLEYSIGQIDAKVAFSDELQANWMGKLASITVDTFADVVDGGDGLTSLREAINNATAGDTILLNAGTYNLTIDGSGENLGATGDLDILVDLNIQGVGADVVTIDASGLVAGDRIFDVRNGTTSISGVTLTGGSATEGGAIDTQSGTTLNLTDMALTGNSSTGHGGAIFMRATSSLNRVTLDNNSAGDSGGGIYFSGAGNGELTNVTFSNNTAVNSGGAFLAFNTNITVTNNTITGTSDGIDGFGGGAAVSIQNTILDNDGGNSAFTLTSLGGNIDVDGTAAGLVDGVNNDQVGTVGTPINVLLGTLDDNGGSVKTHALTAGSAAISGGVAAGAPATDQRGAPRDASPDVGAYEFIAPLSETSEFLVNSTTTDVQETSGEDRGSQQAVSVAADGSYVVAWSSVNQDGSGWGIYARRFDSSGAALTGDVPINQTPADNQLWARVASDASGNFVVTWTSTNQDGTPQSVYARRFDASGTALTNEFRVNTTTTGTQKDSSIAMDNSGNFIITWQGEGPGDADGIFYRRFNADTTAIDVADVLANGSDLGGESDPDVAINDAGQFAIAWAVANDVYVRHLDAAGTPTHVEVQVDTNASNSHAPAIDIDAAGRSVVVYRTDGLIGAGAGVWGRAFNHDGSERITWFEPSDKQFTSNNTSPSIEMDYAGNFVVTYHGVDNGDGDGDSVKVRRYSADGTSLGPSAQVNVSVTGNQNQASVGLLDVNNFVVVWSGEGDQSGETDNSGVFARQYHVEAPVLDLDFDDSSSATGADFDANFNDGGGPVSVVDADGTLFDTNDTNLQSLTVRITDRQDGGSELLAADTTGTSITSSFSGGVLTLSGSDSVANYQQVLRTITYDNSNNPATGISRTITFVANDGITNSNVGTTTMSINGVQSVSLTVAADTYIDKNNQPDNFGNSTSLVVDKSGGDIGNTRTLLQFDLSTIPVGATITEATLKLQATANTAAFDINIYELTESWVEGSGNGTVDAANWGERESGTNWGVDGGVYNSTVIATSNTAAIGEHSWNVTSLVQAWYTGSTVNNGLIIGSPDGGGESVTYDSSEGAIGPALEVLYVIPPNVAPSVTSGGTLTYTEGDGQVAIDSGITLSDADDTNLEGATVAITANHTSTEDLLLFTNQNGITGNFVAATGVLTLSGTATVSQYQTALQSIQYENTCVNPNDQSRTISFMVNDGSDDSNTATRTINVVGTGNLAVDTTSDANDGADTSSISALLINKGTDGKVSLREAIEAANNTLGVDTIEFQISDPLVNGAHTIAIGTGGLDTITEGVIIDGTTDDDYVGAPIIELDGSSAGGAVGLHITGDNVTIRGLVINSFAGHGIQITGDNNRIESSYIGLNVAGDTDRGNGQLGIQINGGVGNVIGGSGVGNVISGNGFAGIAIVNGAANGNTIQGNLIGTDATGMFAIGNDDYGIDIWNGGPDNNLVGGTTADLRNVISGNGWAGIHIGGTGTTGNVIQGNYIGTDINGDPMIGNGTGGTSSNNGGIDIDSGASGNTIGGTVSGAGNLIAHNTGPGVRVSGASSNQNAIQQNEIYSNTDIGIVLSSGNSGRNAAVLTKVITDGTTLSISGTYDDNSLGADTLTIEYFSNPAGAQEGATFLDSDTFTTNGSGTGTINHAITATVTAGEHITAAVTDSAGNTSQFSLPVVAANEITVVSRETVDSDADGQIDHIRITASANLDDDFSGLGVSVAGYALDGSTPFVTNIGAGGANDNVFYVVLQESGTLDTGATPDVDVFANSSLGEFGGAADLAVDTAAVTANDSAGPVLVSAVSAETIDTDIFQTVGQQLDLVFSEALNSLPTESDLETALMFAGGAGDGDNLPSTSSGSNPISFAATNQTDDTIRIVLNANNVLNVNGLTVGTHTVQVVNGALLTDAIGNAASTASAVTIAGDVNDEPTLTATGSDPTFTEGGSAAGLFSAASADPIEAGQVFVSWKVTVTNVIDGADEFLDLDGSSIVLTNAASGTTATNSLSYTVSVLGGVATVDLTGGSLTATQLESIIDAMAYENTSDNPGTSDRIVTITELTDSGGTGGAGDDTASLSITSVVSIDTANDAPTLTGIETSSLSFVEGDPDRPITSTVTVGDVDNANISSAIFQITANYVSGEDVLTFTDTPNISGVFDSLTGTLTLSGSDTIAAYETAIRSVAYQNSSENPTESTRTVSFLISDGNDPSNTVTRDVDVSAVNDRPVIVDLGGDILGYGQGSGPIAIDQGTAAGVTDVDSDDFDGGSLTVSIVAGSTALEDALSVRDDGVGFGEIGFDGLNVTFGGTVIGTAVGGTAGVDLVITFNAAATPTSVSALINHITYENTNVIAPTLGARTVQFTVADGDGGVSISQDTTVQVTAAIAPTISDLDTDSFTYTEGDGPVTIDQGTSATVADADSADFDGGALTVVFASGSDSTEDVLSIRDQGAGAGNIQIAGTDVTYDFGAGATVIGSFTGGTSGAPLVVTFNANATPMAATALVQQLTFENTDTVAPTTGTRTIRVSLTDGDGGTSSAQDVFVNVAATNTASVLSGIEGSSLVYNTASGPVAVTGSLNVADIDDTDIESATIQISAGYVNGQDILAFTNTANIIGTFNATTGTLTLTGTDTVAAYQAAIRSVTFENNSGSPTYGSRTASFTVNDGDDPSNTSTRSVTVTNQSPTGVADTYSMTQNSTLTETPSGVLANDSDPEGDSLTAVLDTGPAHASAFSLGADGSFTYTPTIGFVGADSFTYRAHDGTSASSATTVTINVGANAAPTVVLSNKTTSLDEDVDTSSSIKVADIVVSDDGIGTNTLSLSGADASWFEIVSGNELHLRAGVALDYETNWTLDVTVAVDDASLPGGPEDTYSQAIAIEDVNEAPTLLIVSAVDSINQASSSVVVAEFAIDDDALGEERIVLLGEHASFFEVVGNSVVLRANANAELADVAQLEVTVGLDDLSTSASPDQSIELSFSRAVIAPAPLSSAEASPSTQSSEAEADEEAPSAPLVESVVGGGASSSDSERRFRSPIQEPSEVEKVGPQESTTSAVNADPEVEPTSVFRTAIYTSNASRARVSSVSAFTSQSSIADLAFASNPGVFWTELDAFQETVSTYSTGAIAIGSVSVASSGLTVGYVAWILRGGALMSSLMASLPVWRFMDPMVIISQVGDEDDEDSGSLESIMDRELAESSGSESLPHNDYVSTGQAESTAAKAME